MIIGAYGTKINPRKRIPGTVCECQNCGDSFPSYPCPACGRGTPCVSDRCSECHDEMVHQSIDGRAYLGRR